MHGIRVVIRTVRIYARICAGLTRYGGGILDIVPGIGSEHAIEDLVERFDNGGGRAEVCRELQRRHREMRSPFLHSVLAHLMKQSRLGIAKEIDGLHRIADEEACAAVPGLPVREY